MTWFPWETQNDPKQSSQTWQVKSEGIFVPRNFPGISQKQPLREKEAGGGGGRGQGAGGGSGVCMSGLGVASWVSRGARWPGSGLGWGAHCPHTGSRCSSHPQPHHHCRHSQEHLRDRVEWTPSTLPHPSFHFH